MSLLFKLYVKSTPLIQHCTSKTLLTAKIDSAQLEILSFFFIIHSLLPKPGTKLPTMQHDHNQFGPGFRCVMLVAAHAASSQ